MKTLLSSFILLLLVLMSCTQPPDYPPEPVIEFNSLSQPFMTQGTTLSDSIFLTVDFTDGDGDLGTEDDSLDIYLIDTRIEDFSVPIQFKLPFVPLQGTGNGISGEISLKLPATCCIFPAGVAVPCDTTVTDLYPTDTLIYEVYIKDRAGNESNHILTENIIVLCE